MKEKEKGITLVATVVTIILLLILAGVSIRIAINGGIINKAKTAVTNYSQSADQEGNLLNKLFDYQEAYIEVVKGNITPSIVPSAWTNCSNGKGVIVSLTSDNEKYKVQYQIDTTNGTWEDYKEEKQIEVFKNCTIIARLINIVDTTSKDYTNINVSNIDKIEPTIEKPTASNITTNSFTMNVTVSDKSNETDNASGLAKIDFMYKKAGDTNYTTHTEVYSTNPTNPGETASTTKTYSLANLTSGTYNIKAVAYDLAGNSKESEVTDVTTGTVAVATGNITFYNNPTAPTGENVIVAINTSKSEFTIQYQIDSTSGEWITYNNETKVTVSKNCIIYARLWDGTNGGSYTTDTINNIYKNLTLSVNANGGNYSEKPSLTMNYGETHNLPAPTRTGYTFAGWSLSGGGSISGSTYTFGTSNGTLTANWNANSYTVTLGKDENISSVSGAGTYKYGQSVTVSASPNGSTSSSGSYGVSTGTYTGYTHHYTNTTTYRFNSWTGTYSSSNQSYTFTMPAGNVSLIANGSNSTSTTSSYDDGYYDNTPKPVWTGTGKQLCNLGAVNFAYNTNGDGFTHYTNNSSSRNPYGLKASGYTSNSTEDFKGYNLSLAKYNIEINGTRYTFLGCTTDNYPSYSVWYIKGSSKRSSSVGNTTVYIYAK